MLIKYKNYGTEKRTSYKIVTISPGQQHSNSFTKNKVEKSREDIVIALAEIIYLSTVALHILKVSFDTTLFFIDWPKGYENLLRAIVCITLFMRICASRRCINKRWLLCVFTAVIFKLSWCSTGYTFLLDTALFAIGAMGIPYKKILKTGFWTGVYVLLLAMLGSFSGCITDLVYSEAGQFRHSFGVIYPTDFAAHVVFLSLAGWVLYGGTSILMPMLLYFGLGIFVFYYSRAKCSTIILFLLVIAIGYCFGANRVEKKNKALFRITKCIDSLLPYVMPFCALLIIVLSMLYDDDSKWMTYMNTLLSYRLKLSRSALDTYGISLFGTAFEQIGFGGGTAWTWTYTYNFVDSSYILILVRYGLTALVIMCVQYLVLVKSSLKEGNRKLALAASIVAIHSIMEHHLPETAYNLFLLLPFSELGHQNTIIEEKHNASMTLWIQNKKNLPKILALACGIISIFTFPRIVGYLKTIVTISHLDTPQNHIYFLVIITAIFMAIHLFVWTFIKILNAGMRKTPILKTYYISLCVMPIVLLCTFLIGEKIIRQNESTYRYLLKDERAIIEAILEEEDGKLYVDHVPELYIREFGGISKMVLAAEGLAYKENTTLIVEDSEELKALMDAGYKYGEISPQHAIYTNSLGAKRVLEETGISLTDYYSKQHSIKLADLALRNGLELTEKGTLQLHGSAESLVHGSGVTIYKGKLQVKYNMKLLGSTFNDGTAAVAKVTSDWGLRTWGSKEISISDFEENEEYILTIEMSLPFNCPNVELRLEVQDGVELEVQSIKYGKVE